MLLESWIFLEAMRVILDMIKGNSFHLFSLKTIDSNFTAVCMLCNIINSEAKVRSYANAS
jgi:hypothetical protein